MGLREHEAIEAGRIALRAGDAAAARAAFADAPADSPEILEGLGRAAYLELDFLRATEDWERAYALCREVGDSVGAVRLAREERAFCFRWGRSRSDH